MRSGKAGLPGQQQQPGREAGTAGGQQGEQPDSREEPDEKPLHGSGGDGAAPAARSLAVFSWPQAARMSGPRGVRDRGRGSRPAWTIAANARMRSGAEQR